MTARSTFLRWTAAAALAAFVVPPPHAIAADPVERDRWSAGEIVTVAFASHRATSHDEAPTAERPRVRRLAPHVGSDEFEARYVVRCDEAGADGACVRATVHVLAWREKFGPYDDASLAGALFETGPNGWALLAADRNPSGSARSWIDRTFPAGWSTARTPFEGLDVPHTARAGDGWECDAGWLADAVFGSQEAHPKSARATARFEALDGGRARVVVEHDSSLVEDTRGEVHLRYEAGGRRDAWHRTGSFALTGGYTLHEQGGVHISALSMRWSATEGGALPSPPVRPEGVRVVRFDPGPGWAVGEAVLEIGSETTDLEWTPLDDAAAAKTKPKTDHRVVEWRALWRRIANDERGRPRFRVEMQEWRMSRRPGHEDRSLTGAVLEKSVERLALRSAGAEPASMTATEWIKEHDGARLDDIRCAVAPLMPVAAGDVWRPDPEEARSGILACRANDAGSEAKLASLEGDLGTVDYSVTFGHGSFDSRRKEMASTRLESAEVRGRATGPIARWQREGSFTEEATMLGETTDHPVLLISMTHRRSMERRPAPAAPPAPK